MEGPTVHPQTPKIKAIKITYSKISVFTALLLLTIGHLSAADGEQWGSGDVSSSVAPPGGGLFDINAFVGANTYYNAGITGQNTRSTVTEAGHIWNGTESLTHVTNFYASSFAYGGTNMEPRIDRHATWVAGALGGRIVETNPQIYQKGIAYGTTLSSAAIANTWAGSAYTLSFSWNYNSWTGGILPSFANSDVINQSYGFTDAGGNNAYTRMMDALANSNSKVVSVASAGNSGTAGSVGSPGSGYNSITVGALGNPNSYNSIASFSSRGPQNWGYINSGGTLIVVTNARTVVDIVAPGSSIIAPFYGAQTGGNNPTLSGSTNLGTNPASYTALNGTSFAAPIVSGAASLMMSASKTLPELQGNSEATESVVIKALMLNGATKLTGWNNGQITNSGVVTTTQGLDFTTGAGSLNLAATYTNQTQGTKGVGFNVQGNQGVVEARGWDLGAALIGSTNTYLLSGLFSSNSTFTTTLSWLRQVSMNTSLGSTNATDIAEANLNLRVWTMNPDGSVGTLVGSSQSPYNVTEHLHFQLPNTGYYIVGVDYEANSFDNTGTWGSGTNQQKYGIAWNGSSTENIYWQSGNWDNDGNWNTQANGSGITTSNSSVVVNTVFGDSSPSQTPQSLIVEGNQFSKGLNFQSGDFSITSTNPTTIYVGINGLNVDSTTSGNISFSENTSLAIIGNQKWANNSSQLLEINGAITGFGNLQISNSTPLGGIVLSNVGNIGSISHTGNGVTSINGTISTSVNSVSQSGVGTLSLNGENSYTGGTSVTQGKLSVNGSIASSSLTTVSNQGTLQGSGTVGNASILSGGTINPGNSIGLLTIDGDLTWDINGNYNWEIYDSTGVAGIGYDTINVVGTLDLSLLGVESFNINLWSLSNPTMTQSGDAINFDPNQNYLWTIISTEEGIIGFNNNLFDINTLAYNNTDGFANALNGSFSISQNENDIILAYNTVPEPSTYALLLIGLGIGLIIKKEKIKSFFIKHIDKVGV
jgi:autotransporter-associated beta strand protein